MDNPKQKRGLASALRLRRRARGSSALPPPPVIPLPPVPQPPQQPPVQPVVQQPGWAPAQKNIPANAKDLVGGARQMALAKQHFEKGLKEEMPTIHKAKQFVLTVDAERISQTKIKDDAPIVAELTNLSTLLQQQAKTLETHTTAVRAAVANKDFIAADTEFTAALTLSTTMLAEDANFQAILQRHGKSPVLDLAGDRKTISSAGKEFRRRLALSQGVVEELLQTESDNTAVKKNIAELQKSYDAMQQADGEEKFDVADGLLNEVVEDAEVVRMLVKAAQQFEESVAQLKPEMTMVKKFRVANPTDAQMASQALAIAAHQRALSAADRGNFVKASEELGTARAAAFELFPDGATEARAFEFGWQQSLPRIEEALRVTSDSPYAQKLQQGIRDVKAQIEKDAEKLKFERASLTIDDALLLVQGLRYAVADWEVYVGSKERVESVIASADKVSANSDAQKAFRTTYVAAMQQAEVAIHAGDFPLSKQKLGEAQEAALGLLATGPGADALQYFTEVDAEQSRLKAADKIVPKCGVVTEAKEAYDEAREFLRGSVDRAEFDSALAELDLCRTRAYQLETEHKKYEAIERLQNSYQSVLDAAATADVTLPGVAAAKNEFDDKLEFVAPLLDTNLDQALVKLKEAVTLAHKVNGLIEQAAKQKSRKQELDQTIGLAGKTYLPPGSTDELSKGTVAGTDTLWDFFLIASSVAETTRDAASFTNLELAAKSWLADLKARDPNDPQDPQVAKRKQACETAIKQAKHLKLAARFSELGDLPWDAATEDKAADLQMQALFETGDRPMEQAGDSAFGAKWIVSQDFANGEGKREFVYKAAFETDASEIQGFPRGSEPVREVLGDELAKQLKAMTGLEMNVPETRIVSVDSEKLNPADPGRSVIGSAQAAAPTIGSVVKLKDSNPEAMKKVTPKSAQKAALFDALALNVDRHGNNFLVTPPGESGESELVPIDNGLAFPSREGMEARRGRNASMSAFSDIRSAYEPFDPEILAGIEMIDETTLIAGMKARTNTLQAEQPALNVKTVTPDAQMDLLARNIKFLKKAAPRVSPAVMMDLLMENAVAIFDSPDADFETAIEAVIQKGETRDKHLAPLLDMTDEEKLTLYTDLWKLGWCHGYGNPRKNPGGAAATLLFKVWCLRNPREALTLTRRKKPNPAILAETARYVQEIKNVDPASDIDAKLAGLSPSEARDKAHLVLRGDMMKKGVKEVKQIQKLEADFLVEFPGEPWDPRDSDAYRLYQKYNAKSFAEVNGQKLDNLPFADRWNLLEEYLKNLEKEALKGELDVIRQSPPFLEMNAAFGKYGERVTIPSYYKTEAALGMLTAWEELKALGGITAFIDCGGDCEAIGGGPEYMLAVVRGARSAQGIDVDA
ncbi:hypothetical protein Psta_0145 [Pirellula staleyi DSM 6068]|uniref:PI3K/PI4K catalytic domain-containing protein n=1 Tax=Pirellula staleyi (strain ATCC 27377 / DSM 6068 / ICPB 4128) TaxID=530564 RepID=D2R0H3_PIRSD|nr:hypothetical protein [Pirellula staleyi]ADB14841.1 hypothetical protein Psta_0145 [Pirellula staleyi DSM 6068]